MLRVMKVENTVREEGSVAVGTLQPPDLAGRFSDDGEAIKLHIEGSLTIPITGI